MTTSPLAEYKRDVPVRLRALYAAEPRRLGELTEAVWSEDAVVSVSHPINELRGQSEISAGWLQPLRAALPDLERRDDLVIAGEFRGAATVAMVGHYQGTFERSLLDIPPTHGVVQLRYGEVHSLVRGSIVRSWILVDFLELMRQANVWPLPKSLGTEGTWLAPSVGKGFALDRVDEANGVRSLYTVKAMHSALLSFDGKRLDSMDHAKYWTKDFMWYGPSGIGTTRGLEGFRAHHQIPFLRAVPNRTGGDSIVEVGDGDFVVTGGWPGMSATHTGGDWLGLAPTGKRFTIRVMDFYRLENAMIAENWVPIDIIDILHQLGIDVFDRVRHLAGRPRQSL